METTAAGCLVLMEATWQGGHEKDSRPGAVCDPTTLVLRLTFDVSLLDFYHCSLRDPLLSLSGKQKHTCTHTHSSSLFLHLSRSLATATHFQLHTTILTSTEIIWRTLSWIIKRQMMALGSWAFIDLCSPIKCACVLSQAYSASKKRKRGGRWGRVGGRGSGRWRRRGVLMWGWNVIWSLCRISLNGPCGRRTGTTEWRWRVEEEEED